MLVLIYKNNLDHLLNKKALTYTIEQTVRPSFNMDETIKNVLEQWKVLKTKLLPA